ncbi:MULTISPECIES: cell envelope integrity protein TolA [Pseudomonadaceae]|uniref:Cell envelope integrity protein TolA n=1 Tax=Ectopseudomonas hydrolytica TaxID=2493633 RepID=A0ABY5AF29_9GAMM|nr:MULTISPECIES: cell envelope integrity protein TolA [Pseudomonas]ATH83205.1 protein TolA [Pseudomonas mendocina]MBF8163553.1 cell envelope integrity protein TolA [Pseudomonas mendocina]MDH0096297.1 cell envelope integrity protein TolA [Pseudomonas sp. GD04158]USR42185.1 cell envelope integrity protein TolA [Pseudomonas hydrolytica]UTH34120.1 cell envelope integrity protein TolA [Pseudomonas hydrolytica]
MMQQTERSQSESYFWPVVWAVGLHVLMFAMLFVSFAFTPELPPARPVVQATLYQLQSQSQATTQTTQKVAGEAQKTSAPQFETERLEQKKAEEQKQAQAEAQKVAAAKKAEEQKKAEEARKAEQAKAEAAKKAEAEKAAEQKRQADIAKKRAEEEAKKKAAEEAKKKAAAEEAKKKAAAAEAAKKKAAEDAKRKAEEARRKAAEDQKAAALAELLSDNVQNQQALAETHGDKVAGNLDDLIIKLITENWQRPMSARRGMSVELLIQMLPDGTVTNASVSRSSGDAPFDSSAVAAVRNVGRIPEMQQLDRATFDRMYRQRRVIFKPED